MSRRKIELEAAPGSMMIDMATGRPIEKATVPLICRRIRYYREARGMEQKLFARQIGVSGNAVSNWERGRSRPDVNLLPAICRTLQITFYDLFGEESPSELFSEREKKLVSGYRNLNPGNQYTVDKLMETLGFVQATADRPEIKKLMYFDRPLAAGAGDPTEFEQDAIPIYLYASPEVKRADYVFAVNGDSMEPDYRSGDLVLVRRSSDSMPLAFGETGAFIVGNEIYIKRYEKDGLHSLNQKYAVLHFDEEQAVYLIGRVLGSISSDCIADETAIDAYLTLQGISR